MSAIVIMGVCGTGKTDIGTGVAAALAARFVEGDDLHSDANRAKMGRGEPLTDADRWPWLERAGQELATGTVVLACSALRRVYRDRIRQYAGGPVMFVHLTGARETIAARMAARTDHYMPPVLLDSQLALLEVPEPDEQCINVDVSGSAASVLAEVLKALT
ncbi:MAG: gluconokinase [Rhodobacteraceae bacterium]|nr:gluconokinase [Paracoccaceae bacterium]